MDNNATTDEDKIDMIKYFGKEIDLEDWKISKKLSWNMNNSQFNLIYYIFPKRIEKDI